MIKKIIFISIFSLFYWVSYAIDFSTISSIENSCSEANISQTIYIPTWQTSVNQTVWDAFWHPQDRYISNAWTLVKLWTSDNALVTWCTSSANWQKVSDVAPGNNERVVALYSTCTFNRPTNIANRTLQFVFNVRHWAIWWWNTNQTRYYYPLTWWNNSPSTRLSKNYSNYYVSNYQVHWNECLNITLAWCWDWTLDTWESCDDWNNIDWDWCSATCTTPGWWGGWSSCVSWWVTWSQSSTISVSTPNLCLSWVTVWNFTSTVSWNTTNYSWTCWWVSWWNCSASYTSSSWGWGWWGSRSSSWWWSNICWDWALQRPNSVWIMEECDFGSDYTKWPAWCSLPTDSNPCNIIENTTPWGLTDRNNSIPSWWTIEIFPSWNILIWDDMDVFGYLSSNYAYIQNNSTSDIYIDTPLCIYKQNNTYNVLDWQDMCSWDVVWYLQSWWKKNLEINSNTFLWNTSNLPSWVLYWNAQIITTLKWLQNTNSFLKSALNVRVAKPSISTFGWWASLLNWNNISDINKLSFDSFALLRPELNKNLILTSLWINPLSSYVKSTSDSTIISKSEEEWNKDLSTLKSVNSSLSSNTINKLPEEIYNWLENVFIHVWDVKLSSQNITWANKTYIIENWDLEINWNITSSSSNILFVVKNGNIIINSSVTQIDAVLIDFWWKIMWNISSQNKLLVNWALYWDVDNLISKRTYVKNQWNYVNVWVNVNFTSKIFDSPPPLFGRFLWEYLEWNKIPK